MAEKVRLGRGVAKPQGVDAYERVQRWERDGDGWLAWKSPQRSAELDEDEEGARAGLASDRLGRANELPYHGPDRGKVDRACRRT
jgi:hypothetical protein